MEVTGRYWGTAGIAIVLALWALFVQRPVFVIGAAALGAWLLTLQYQFVRTTRQAADQLNVAQELDRERFVAGETALATLRVTIDPPTTVTIRVSTPSPLDSSATAATCELSPGDEEEKTHFDVAWPTAGRFSLASPTVTIRDRLGLFSQSLTTDSKSSVTVEPRASSNMHIGEGGDRIEFGEFESGLVGSGLTPDEVRQYVPGDNTNRIDWKATARLNDAYVREFETETDLETVLVFDHRAAMNAGKNKQRKVDLAREVALAIVGNAEALGERLSWYAVGDGGLTQTLNPSTNPNRYRLIAQRLRVLEPTEASSDKLDDENIDPARVRQTADQLASETAFDQKLKPFFNSEDNYVQRIASEPLFGAIRAAKAKLDENIRTIIISDDTNRVELREAVKAASSGRGRVIVFLTPTALFGTTAVADLETAYRRYTEFESFRRELTSLAGVRAYEVGPSDRLNAILSAGGHQRRDQQ